MSDPTIAERRRDLEKRFERIRRQNLLIFLVGVLVLSGLGIEIHASDSNCRRQVTANRSFNEALDQLIVSASTAVALTETQKLERISHYARLHQPIYSCPLL